MTELHTVIYGWNCIVVEFVGILNPVCFVLLVFITSYARPFKGLEIILQEFTVGFLCLAIKHLIASFPWTAQCLESDTVRLFSLQSQRMRVRKES